MALHLYAFTCLQVSFRSQTRSALGYLYSSASLNIIRPDNARAVLAAGCLLGGMEDLCQYTYETCRRSITVDSIGSWLQFLDTIPATPSSPNGAATPDLSPPRPNTVFGLYAQRIRDDVFHFLVETLPEMLDVQGSAPPEQSQDATGKSGRDVLLQIYSRVPFEMFKAAVESPTFRIGTPSSHTHATGMGANLISALAYRCFQDPTSRDSSLPKKLLKFANEGLPEVLVQKKPWYLHSVEVISEEVQYMLLGKCASARCGKLTHDRWHSFRLQQPQFLMLS